MSGALTIALIYASFLAVGWWAPSSRRRRAAPGGSSITAGPTDFMLAGRGLPL